MSVVFRNSVQLHTFLYHLLLFIIGTHTHSTTDYDDAIIIIAGSRTLGLYVIFIIIHTNIIYILKLHNMMRYILFILIFINRMIAFCNNNKKTCDRIYRPFFCAFTSYY